MQSGLKPCLRRNEARGFLLMERITELINE